MAARGVTVRTICLHGPESTGKSTIAPRLGRWLGAEVVAEYGRTWAEANGTDMTMADLVHIAQVHDAQTRAAVERANAAPVILDTDPLMTAIWADMLFGRRDAWFDRWQGTADLYLLFDIDLPWVEDGTRMFGRGEDRRRFFDLSRQELKRRGVRWALVSGTGACRYRHALQAVRAAR